ncbi:hypothetical protein OG698_03010 [Streptomyces sp. NBC_01003]|nr:hypothetical protein OG698_03010 [Streptomyces sp. NBC_01003]
MNDEQDERPPEPHWYWLAMLLIAVTNMVVSAANLAARLHGGS